MRLLYYFSSIIFYFIFHTALASDQKIDTAQTLRDVLISGYIPLEISSIKVEHGCFESQCFEIVDKLFINKETGAISNGFHGKNIVVSIFPNQNNLLLSLNGKHRLTRF